MGLGDKRWKSEKVSVIVGDVLFVLLDYKVEVFDKGVEIDIDVDIFLCDMLSGVFCFDGDEVNC